MRPLLILLCVFTLSACATAGSQESGVGGWVSAKGDLLIPEADRVAAPKVSATTLEGDTLTLADFDGPVLVNFWASWCAPCATEAPHLQAVHDNYTERGLSVVGVNIKDSVANARSFERDFGVSYPSWYDESGTIAATFGGLGPAGLPSTLLLDREHRVAVRLFGAVTGARLAPYLEELLQ